MNDNDLMYYFNGSAARKIYAFNIGIEHLKN